MGDKFIIENICQRVFVMSMHKQQQIKAQSNLMRSYNLRRHPHLATFSVKLNQTSSHPYQTLNHSMNSSMPLKNQCKKQIETIQGSRDSEIYFNRAKKYNYMKNIIDTYFEESRKEKNWHIHSNNPQDGEMMKNSGPIIPKIFKNKNKEEITKELKEVKNQIKNRVFLVSKRRNKIIVNAPEVIDQLKDSLTESRLVEANQTHSPDQGTKNISLCSRNTTTILPPINQILEDKDDDYFLGHYDSVSYINEETMESNRQEKMVMIQNQIYRIEMVIINGRPSYKIKTFKEKGAVIMERELKAKYLGAEPLWIEYKYDPRCLISSNNRSIKDLLFKVKPMDMESKFLVLKPKKYYKKLIANNCEQLKRIIIQFCSFMKRFEGKIVNNKINLSNLFLSKNQNMRLGQWGFSSFREMHLIQSIEFQNRIEPIIKSQKEWFIPPEYLAPEIMRAIIEDESIDLMSYGSAPDIWSLGIAILQMVTVIPVWIPQKCGIHSKSSAPRTGLLAFPDRDLKKLLKKQQKLIHLVQKLIEEQYQDQKINASILQALYRCLDFNPESRGTYTEIIELLK